VCREHRLNGSCTRLYSSEPCGVSACTINLFLDTSPSTETLNFLFERIELIGLIKRVGKFNFDNLYSNRGAMLCQRLLRYPRISQPETLLPKSEPISVRKPNALKCRAVMCTKSKLTCIKQVSFFNVPMNYFLGNFLE
jgi:hypothetical protein